MSGSFTAGELKDACIKDEMRGGVGVIAIGEDFWWHVHDDEELPGADYTIALHPRWVAEKPGCIIPGLIA